MTLMTSIEPFPNILIGDPSSATSCCVTNIIPSFGTTPRIERTRLLCYPDEDNFNNKLKIKYLASIL